MEQWKGVVMLEIWEKFTLRIPPPPCSGVSPCMEGVVGSSPICSVVSISVVVEIGEGDLLGEKVWGVVV